MKGLLRGFRHSLIVVGVLGTMLASIFSAPLPRVAAYSCTGPSCYGLVSWRGSVPGLSTVISLHSVNSGNPGRLNNETWLVNDSTCSSMCWVEAGFTSTNGSTTYYFRENKTPSQPYRLDILDPVPAGDYNGTVNVQIVQDINVTSWYNVYIIANSGQRTFTYQQNPWFPDRIDIGEELQGTSGAYSPQIAWTQNGYISANGSGQLQGYYQNRLPDRDERGNPPYAGWAVDNNPAQSTTGGIWLANCC